MGFEQVMSVRGGTAAWTEAGRHLIESDTRTERPQFAESEWTHAGAFSYSI
jgi:hypothetical protein